MIPALNDGSGSPPRLRRDLNMGTLLGLPEWSTAPKAEGVELLHAVKEAGFEGAQGADPELCREVDLACSGSFRTGKHGVANDLVKQRKEQGFAALTTHVGWGIEGDDEVDAYVDEVLEASAAHGIPVFIETHRATVAQDAWRTVQLVKRRPEIRFNGDFSHWYTGHEMPYGDLEMKLDFMQPVFDGVRFFHGRIGNSSHMQVAFTRDDDNVATFKEMWTRSMVGFLKTAVSGDVLPFAPELLPPSSNYARTFPGPDGKPREETDRWQQALLMLDIAQECFDDALSRVANNG